MMVDLFLSRKKIIMLIKTKNKGIILKMIEKWIKYEKKKQKKKNKKNKNNKNNNKMMVTMIS